MAGSNCQETLEPAVRGIDGKKTPALKITQCDADAFVQTVDGQRTEFREGERVAGLLDNGEEVTGTLQIQEFTYDYGNDRVDIIYTLRVRGTTARGESIHAYIVADSLRKLVK